MKYFQFFIFITLLSCGTVQKLGLRTMSPLFKKSGDYLTQERNWTFFKEATPANLKFLELLYLQDQSNLDLLELLIKGYAGYAFAVPETLLFEDEIKGVENSLWKKEALDFYTRAFDYGLNFLEKRNISSKILLSEGDEGLKEIINSQLSESDIVSVLYFAQSWGSLINLQKDNIALVAQVPKVKMLFDWVCELRPNIDHGVCDIFYAQYEASRPKMLGGDPEKARKMYQEAIQKMPHHLLIRMSYIQFSILPSYDEEEYNKLSSELLREIERWENFDREFLSSRSEYKNDSDLNLYNAIAKKRLQIIEQNKKHIF